MSGHISENCDFIRALLGSAWMVDKKQRRKGENSERNKKNQDPFKNSEVSGLTPEPHAVGIRCLRPTYEDEIGPVLAL